MKHRKGGLNEKKPKDVGFPHSPSTLYHVVIKPKPMTPWWRMQMKGVGGVTLKGCETDDLPPMNPEGVEVDAHQSGCMSIKDYIS